MKKTIFLIFSTLFIFGINVSAQEEPLAPYETYIFAERDSCDLYLDLYKPAEGFDSASRPTIVFAFGGGFISGSRNDPFYNIWFRKLTENGCTVVSIDYRLGLKGAKKIGKTTIKPVEKAIKIAAEDMISALAFLDANADEFGIDPSKIIISGSSAGAITALQTEYEIYNRTALASELRPDFTLGGVIAFAGAIFSRKGKLKYAEKPCPTQMFHGTEDKLVVYGQIRCFNIGFFGSSKVAERMNKLGYDYQMFHYVGHGHEISAALLKTFDKQIDFIESCVMKGQKKVIDKHIDDPTIEYWRELTPKDLTR